MQRGSRTHEGHFIFVDNQEEMVQNDQQAIELLANATQYFWVDAWVVGIVFVFRKAGKLKTYHQDVGSFYDWSIS